MRDKSYGVEGCLDNEIINCFFLFTRFIIIVSPRMRVYLFCVRFRLIKRQAIGNIVRRSKLGDWMLLYVLGDNIDSVVFRDIVHDLSHRLEAYHNKNSTVRTVDA